MTSSKVKVTVKNAEPVKQKVQLAIGGVEEGLPIPTQERESKYEFGLNELNEKQSRFIGSTTDVTIEKLKLALRNAISKEREGRNYRQNFIMRNENKGGIEGVRVFCVNMQDKPMRSDNKTAKVA